MRITKIKKPGKPRTKVGKDTVKTASETSGVKPTKPRKNMIANLGSYAHPAKMPTGAKIGAGTVKKTTKRKLLNARAQKGFHDNV